MTPIELYEHQRHLSASIHDLESRIPTMIRQQRRVPPGLPHAGAYIVSSGKPCWEWVEKGSADDRSRPYRAGDQDE